MEVEEEEDEQEEEACSYVFLGVSDVKVLIFWFPIEIFLIDIYFCLKKINPLLLCFALGVCASV